MYRLIATDAYEDVRSRVAEDLSSGTRIAISRLESATGRGFSIEEVLRASKQNAQSAIFVIRIRANELA